MSQLGFEGGGDGERGDSTGPENPPRWKVEAHYGGGCGIGKLCNEKAIGP